MTPAQLQAMADRHRREAAKRLLKAAAVLQAEHRRDLSRGNPAPHGDPAPPGEFPKARTGNLVAQVGVEPDPAAVLRELRARVGLRPAGFYGGALRRRGWRGLRDTLDRARDRVRAALGAA